MIFIKSIASLFFISTAMAVTFIASRDEWNRNYPRDEVFLIGHPQLELPDGIYGFDGNRDVIIYKHFRDRMSLIVVKTVLEAFEFPLHPIFNPTGYSNLIEMELGFKEQSTTYWNEMAKQERRLIKEDVDRNPLENLKRLALEHYQKGFENVNRV